MKSNTVLQILLGLAVLACLCPQSRADCLSHCYTEARNCQSVCKKPQLCDIKCRALLDDCKRKKCKQGAGRRSEVDYQDIDLNF